MDINKLINDLIKQENPSEGNNRVSINEYITNNMVKLYRYLLLTDKEKIELLPMMFYYLIYDYVEKIYGDNERRERTYETLRIKSMYDFIEWMRDNDKKSYYKFGKLLLKDMMEFNLPHVDGRDYPAWAFFDSPSLIKNQWLIHFTKYPLEIAKEGFKYGIDDHTVLGLTTHYEDFMKRFGGYNFAYDIYDFYNYAYSRNNSNSFKYGTDAVIFRASGISVWHVTDEEEQVIFYGNTASNIIPILDGYTNKFGVHDKDMVYRKIYYEDDDIENVVKWILTNFEQYRKRIVW